MSTWSGWPFFIKPTRFWTFVIEFKLFLINYKPFNQNLICSNWIFSNDVYSYDEFGSKKLIKTRFDHDSSQNFTHVNLPMLTAMVINSIFRLLTFSFHCNMQKCELYLTLHNKGEGQSHKKSKLFCINIFHILFYAPVMATPYVFCIAEHLRKWEENSQQC